MKGKVRVKGEEAEAGSALASFGAHRKALKLFDLVVADWVPLARQTKTARLVSQQIASADSIAANIEEGYGRGSGKEYSHFLIIARGSAQETAGRYLRFRYWLPEELVTSPARLCQEIIAFLTASIRALRASERERTK